MTLQLGAVELLALCFKYSGLHSIGLEDARLYGKRVSECVKRVTGDAIIILWGPRYLGMIDPRIAYVDEDVAEMRCGLDDLGVILIGVPEIIKVAAEQTEWTE